MAQAVGDFVAGAVGTVEGRAKVRKELRAVGLDVGAESIEDFHGKAGGVGGSLEHQRRDCADEDGLGDAAGAVAADVAGDLAAAGGVAHVDCVFEVEVVDELGEIVGVGVEVVAVEGLAGAPMTAAVVRDTAVALVDKEVHLVFKGVGV